MGEAKRRRSLFLKENPTCCFCGGRSKSESEDHVPARSIFDERQWPQGYRFPACDPCNNLTSQDEEVVAFITRLNVGQHNPTAQQFEEFKKRLEAIRIRYPNVYRAMRPSQNEVRRYLRASGIPRPPVSLTQIPVIKIGHPEFVRPMKNFGIKLGCALFYKHVGRILSADWRVAIRFFTNTQTPAGIDELLKALPHRPDLKRGRRDLTDQFNYIFGVTPTLSAFVCTFRNSCALSLVVCKDDLSEAFAESPARGIFLGHPFRH